MEIAVAVVFIVFLVIAALYVSMQKKDVEDEGKMPVIHTSGIYSVIRKSPRENVFTKKPGEEEMKSFLKGLEKDSAGAPLSDPDREALRKHFFVGLEKHLAMIEDGDRRGVQRFLFRVPPRDKACAHLSGDRYFITREDIYRHPELIPPFFPGCGCELFSEAEWKSAMEIEHFTLGAEERFTLPSWKQAIKLS